MATYFFIFFPDKLLEKHEVFGMCNDVELLARASHPNVLQLIGMCEEQDTLFFVLEDGAASLKQGLLDSRALVHYPAYAEKNQRVSTLAEETVLDICVGVARGMEYLQQGGVSFEIGEFLSYSKTWID